MPTPSRPTWPPPKIGRTKAMGTRKANEEKKNKGPGGITMDSSGNLQVSPRSNEDSNGLRPARRPLLLPPALRSGNINLDLPLAGTVHPEKRKCHGHFKSRRI